MRKRGKGIVAILQVVNLVVAVFAFCMILGFGIGENNVVKIGDKEVSLGVGVVSGAMTLEEFGKPDDWVYDEDLSEYGPVWYMNKLTNEAITEAEYKELSDQYKKRSQGAQSHTGTASGGRTSPTEVVSKGLTWFGVIEKGKKYLVKGDEKVGGEKLNPETGKKETISAEEVKRIKALPQDQRYAATNLENEFADKTISIAGKDVNMLTALKDPKKFNLFKEGTTQLTDEAADIFKKEGLYPYFDKEGNFYGYGDESGMRYDVDPATGKISEGVRAPFKFTSDWGFFAGHLAEGAIAAGAAAGATQLIGRLVGADENLVNALTASIGSAIMTTKLIWGLSAFSNAKVAGGFGAFGQLFQKGAHLGWGWGGIAGGALVGWLVFEATYKQTNQQVVTFECKSWEAPKGGGDCEKCNSELYPCTEYRCKSLGQSCELINKGTGQEKCAWVNRNDVSPPEIESWEDALSEEYEYSPDKAVSPPDRGVQIINPQVSDKCLKAFTPLVFGIKTDEPAQCKIDWNRTRKYEDMQFYFGGSNIYNYEHMQMLNLPSPEHLNSEVPELQSDGTYSLYVKCKDANGNENDVWFVFNFCVEKGPDVTPPQITGMSIWNDMPVQYGLNETSIEAYINEPSDCRWSRLDMSYDSMENSMICSQHVWEMNNQMLYRCTSTLTGLKDRQDNIFYFRCKDQPWLEGTERQSDRNVNVESYKFTLKGTQPLTITKVEPKNKTVTGAGTLAIVNFEITTDNGYNFGDSWCSYSSTGAEDSYIEFFETGTNVHKQRLDLPAGSYTYYFRCIDLGGNSETTTTSFEVEIDRDAPRVVRVYNDAGKLKVITSEKSSCAYQTNRERACNFQIGEGTNMPYANSTEHFADWKARQTYYIKCEDSNGNQPLPDECSIVVIPT